MCYRSKKWIAMYVRFWSISWLENSLTSLAYVVIDHTVETFFNFHFTHSVHLIWKVSLINLWAKLESIILYSRKEMKQNEYLLILCIVVHKNWKIGFPAPKETIEKIDFMKNKILEMTFFSQLFAVIVFCC